MRGVAMITRHSHQKVTEVVQLAEKKGVKLPLDEEMSDPWLVKTDRNTQVKILFRKYMTFWQEFVNLCRSRLIGSWVFGSGFN